MRPICAICIINNEKWSKAMLNAKMESSLVENLQKRKLIFSFKRIQKQKVNYFFNEILEFSFSFFFEWFCSNVRTLTHKISCFPSFDWEMKKRTSRKTFSVADPISLQENLSIMFPHCLHNGMRQPFENHGSSLQRCMLVL